MKTVNVLRDYQFNGGTGRRYATFYRASTIYTNVREPVAAELEREGAGTIVGTITAAGDASRTNSEGLT